MPGIPPYSQPGTNGGGQTVAVTQRPELERLNLDQTSSVASGSSQTTSIYAPAGSVYSVQDLALDCHPDGNASSGSHLFRVFPLGGALQSLQGQSDNTLGVKFAWGYWVEGNQKKEPTDPAVQNMQATSLKATSNASIDIQYTNNLDVAQDNKRVIRVIVEEASY